MIRTILSLVVSTALLGGCANIQGVNSSGVLPTPMAVETRPASDRATLVYELLAGEIAGKRGAFKEAAQHYQNASELSDDPSIAERSTRIALFASNWDQALQSVERWIELQPDNIEAREAAGLLYIQDKQSDKAFTQFDRVIDSAGDERAELFNQLGASIGKENTHPETLQVFDRLRQKYSDIAASHLTYAKLSYRAEKFEEALSGIESTLAIEPDNSDALILQNRIYLNTGRSDLALASMAKLAEAKPEDASIHLDYARMLVQVKRYPEALDAFSRVMELLPQDTNLIYSVALLHVELGQHKEAREYLRKLTASHPHRDAAHYYLGRIEEVEKNWDKAMGWYLRVGEGEYYYDARANVAEMQAKLGLVSEARASLQQLRNETSAESVRVRLYLAEGQILREADALEDAMSLYNEVLESYPGNVELHYARGMLGEQMGRLDLLEQDMKEILKQEPDNATTLNALGYTLVDRTERIDEGMEYIRKALALRPDDAAILDSLGWAYYRKGNLEKSLEYLNKAHALFQDPEISMHLGEVLWAAGQHDKAIETVNQALEKSPDYVGLQELLKRISQ